MKTIGRSTVYQVLSEFLLDLGKGLCIGAFTTMFFTPKENILPSIGLCIMSIVCIFGAIRSKIYQKKLLFYLKGGVRWQN